MLKQIISFLLLLSPVGLLSQSDEIRHALQEYRYNEVLALLENEPPHPGEIKNEIQLKMSSIPSFSTTGVLPR